MYFGSLLDVFSWWLIVWEPLPLAVTGHACLACFLCLLSLSPSRSSCWSFWPYIFETVTHLSALQCTIQ